MTFMVDWPLKGIRTEETSRPKSAENVQIFASAGFVIFLFCQYLYKRSISVFCFFCLSFLKFVSICCNTNVLKMCNPNLPEIYFFSCYNTSFTEKLMWISHLPFSVSVSLSVSVSVSNTSFIENSFNGSKPPAPLTSFGARVEIGTMLVIIY